MVSQDSPPQHPDTTNILHQFITTQNPFDNHHHHHHNHQSQHFDAYHPNTLIPHSSIGLLPTNHSNIQSLREESAQMSHTRRLMDLLGATTANDTAQHHHHHHNQHHHQQQRLSLSLNSNNILVPSIQQQQYKQRPLNSSNELITNYLVSDNNNDEYAFASSSSSAPMSRHCSNLYGGVIAGSRYLKPTQSLLEEMVNVGGREIDLSNDKYAGKLFRGSQRGGLSLSSELRAELCSAGLVPTTDKQEAQLKLAKLISLIQEVENRYEKYYHQMEEVMSTFEVIAGQGKAKPYTALALQAMSRHFSSLRDAIVSRINAERRKLLQDLPKISAGLSQLSLFDRDHPQSSGNNNNNNKISGGGGTRISLQHLGLIQTQQRQAWRPIRGLPETSVAILRAWLFEHFLHPYPNESEKLMLASQTGLSKNQVSNWFINARVRLWKPMIEEMYKEEFGDSSEDSNPLGVGGSLANEGVSVTDHEED